MQINSQQEHDMATTRNCSRSRRTHLIKLFLTSKKKPTSISRTPYQSDNDSTTSSSSTSCTSASQLSRMASSVPVPKTPPRNNSSLSAAVTSETTCYTSLQQKKMFLCSRRRDGNPLMFFPPMMSHENLHLDVYATPIKPKLRNSKFISQKEFTNHNQSDDSTMNTNHSSHNQHQSFSIAQRTSQRLENSCEMFYGEEHDEYISPRYVACYQNNNQQSKLVSQSPPPRSVSALGMQRESTKSPLNAADLKVPSKITTIPALQQPSDVLKKEMAAIRRRMRLNLLPKNERSELLEVQAGCARDQSITENESAEKQEYNESTTNSKTMMKYLKCFPREKITMLPQILQSKLQRRYIMDMSTSLDKKKKSILQPNKNAFSSSSTTTTNNNEIVVAEKKKIELVDGIDSKMTALYLRERSSQLCYSALE